LYHKRLAREVARLPTGGTRQLAEKGESMRSRNKWYLLIVGSAFAFALALAAGLHGHRSYREFKANYRGKTCVNQVRALADSLRVYATEHEDRFPDRISALYPEFVPDLQAFICPEVSERYKRERGVPHPFSPDPTSEEIDSLSSYAVVPGLSTSDDSDTVIVYEKTDNHSNVKRIRADLAGRMVWDSPED